MRRPFLALFTQTIIGSACIALLLGASCPPRQTAALTTQAVHTALSAVDDAEMALYCVDAAVSPCVPANRVPSLTKERHVAFSLKMAHAFDVEHDLALKLKAWHPGDGPLTLPALGHAVNLVLDVALEFVDTQTGRVISLIRIALTAVDALRVQMGSV